MNLDEPIDLIQIKVCNRCKDPKPLEEFRVHTNKRKRKDGSLYVIKYLDCYCRKCNVDCVMEYAKNNPQYADKVKKSVRNSWKKYGDRYAYERRAKENIGKAFKRRPKPILGYQLVKGHDGMWRFLKIDK